MAAATALSRRLASAWERLNGPARLLGVDLARGLAVLGMFAAHMYALPDFSWADAATWPAVASGRSSILFATLAGVSLALMTGGPRVPSRLDAQRARGRIVVRAGFVWMLGLLLIATRVPVLVILPAYAILFLLSLPFLRWEPGGLFALAGVLAVGMPFVQARLDQLPMWTTPEGGALGLFIGWAYPFPVWTAFLLCGMAIGRLPLRSWRTQLVLVGAGAAAAVIGYGLDAFGDEASGYWSQVWTARPHSSGVLEVVGSGGFAVAVIGLSLLACRTWLRWVVLPLRATGAMPLTAYTGQLLAWSAVSLAVLGSARDLAGFRALDPFVPFAVVTITACTAWALLVGRGPLEWLVDRLTRIAAGGADRAAR